MRIFVGLSVFVAAAAICALNAHMFLAVRPLNLRDQTAMYTRLLIEALTSEGIPKEAIATADPQVVKDEKASWKWHDLSVHIPPDMPLDELVKRIEFNAVKMGVSPTVLASEQNMRLLQISLGSRVFANLQVIQDVPAEQTEVKKRLDSEPDLATVVDSWMPSWTPPTQECPPFPFIEEPTEEDQALEDEEPAEASPEPEPQPVSGPRVSIILDDGGYGGEVTDTILALNPALTVAILPGTPHAQTTATRAHELGFEVILHMPMDDAKLPCTVTAKMPEAKITRLLNKALDYVPNAVGVSNHMGSMFTANMVATDALIAAIQKLGLYFIDSRTTDKTRAYELAEKAGIPAASRNVFLDNEADPKAIQKEFDRLIQLALEQGSAIGICHFRPVTAAFLKEALPQLKGKGVELVHASELVQ